MAIYEYTSEKLNEISETEFKTLGIKERADLQRLLRDQIEIVAPECLVISEEFGDWEEGNRRIDCLLYTSPSPRDRTRSRMPSSA